MADELCQLWWMFTIKGLVCVVFAFTCYFFSSFVALNFLQPMGFLYLLVVFTFYICLMGIILLVGAIHAFDEKLRHRWLLLAEAILNLVLGPAFLMTFGFGLGFSMIVVLFGLHALILGAGYCAIAFHAGHPWQRFPMLAAAGIWSVLCGIGLIFYRQAHVERLTVGAAVYTAILGLLLVFISVRQHRTERRLSAAV